MKRRTESGIVMAFRRSNSPVKNVAAELKGINKEKICCVVFEYKPAKTLENDV